MTTKLRSRFFMLLSQKEQREGRRIRNRELAQALDIAEHTVGRWVRDEVTRFDADMIERICDYLECDIADLFYLERT